jgi:hypothetical protein
MPHERIGFETILKPLQQTRYRLHPSGDDRQDRLQSKHQARVDGILAGGVEMDVAGGIAAHRLPQP